MSANEQLQQAYQLIRAGNRQEAVQILMPVLRADPANADGWWLLANAVTDPSQQRRALNEVLKLRPNDEKALRMLNQVSAAPSAPDPLYSTPSYPERTASPISDPFAGSQDPFASAQDPFATGRKAKDPTPVYTPPVSTFGPAGNVPPAPIYTTPAQRRGPSCCLITSCLLVLIFCIAPLACVGAGLAGLSPVFNDVARTAGAPDFQNLINVFSGAATPLPGSMLDDMFSQLGVSNFGDLQATVQDSIDQMATLSGTPGFSNTLEAIAGLPTVGEPLNGTPVNRGNIEAGQSIDGTISSGSIGNSYVLTASANTTYVIDAVGSNSDTTLAVLDSGNIVVAVDDDGGSGTDARITFTPSSAGKYTIVVGSYASEGGSYTLTVTQQ